MSVKTENLSKSLESKVAALENLFQQQVASFDEQIKTFAQNTSQTVEEIKSESESNEKNLKNLREIF